MPPQAAQALTNLEIRAHIADNCGFVIIKLNLQAFMTRKRASSPAPIINSIVVRHSKIHGNGVFATRKIPEDAFIIEYGGKRISQKEADRRKAADPDNPFHTFFFSLDNGKLIDGDDGGSDARWINHSCDPNCEAREEDGQIHIHAVRDIRRGEELNYDYGLILDERYTKAVKRAYACLCGAENCRKTLLAPKEKKKKKRKKKKD
jgi:uncharacterized protein